MIQNLTFQGLSKDKVIDTQEYASRYMQKLKFMGRTNYLYYKDSNLQIIDEKVSKKFVKDLEMTTEEYIQLEQEQFQQQKKKDVVVEEAPQKKKDEEADTVKELNKKVTFSADTKE